MYTRPSNGAAWSSAYLIPAPAGITAFGEQIAMSGDGNGMAVSGFEGQGTAQHAVLLVHTR